MVSLARDRHDDGPAPGGRLQLLSGGKRYNLVLLPMHNQYRHAQLMDRREVVEAILVEGALCRGNNAAESVESTEGDHRIYGLPDGSMQGNSGAQRIAKQKQSSTRL